MSERNLFEIATKKKFRFPFRGEATIEDLWDLSLTNLDAIYKTLNAENKETAQESLLTVNTAANTILTDKINIIKHIVTAKQLEITQRLNKTKKDREKQILLRAIEDKKNKDLGELSVEELTKKLEEL